MNCKASLFFTFFLGASTLFGECELATDSLHDENVVHDSAPFHQAEFLKDLEEYFHNLKRVQTSARDDDQLNTLFTHSFNAMLVIKNVSLMQLTLENYAQRHQECQAILDQYGDELDTNELASIIHNRFCSSNYGLNTAFLNEMNAIMEGKNYDINTNNAIQTLQAIVRIWEKHPNIFK